MSFVMGVIFFVQLTPAMRGIFGVEREARIGKYVPLNGVDRCHSRTVLPDTAARTWSKANRPSENATGMAVPGNTWPC